MNLIKKSFQVFKKHFYSLFLIEASFWFLVLFFLVYVKKKLAVYINIFTQYTPQLAGIQQAAQENTLDNNAALQTLTLLENTTQEAMVFAFIIVPLVLFMLWCVFQTVSWLIIKEKKVKSVKSYFWKFTLVSLIVFVPLVFFISRTANQFSQGESPDTIMFKVMLYLFIATYILLISYAVNDGGTLKNLIRRIGHISIKKFHIVIVPIILYFILLVVNLFLFFILFNSYMLNTFFFLSPVPLIIYFLLCLCLFIFFKIVINEKIAAIK